jgi:hypothetical protein
MSFYNVFYNFYLFVFKENIRFWYLRRKYRKSVEAADKKTEMDKRNKSNLK